MTPQDNTDEALETLLKAENTRHAIKVRERSPFNFTVTIHNEVSKAAAENGAKRLPDGGYNAREVLAKIVQESLTELFRQKHDKFPDITEHELVEPELMIRRNDRTYSMQITHKQARQILDEVATDTGSKRSDVMRTLVKMGLAAQTAFTTTDAESVH